MNRQIRNPVVIIDASSENELEIRNPIITIDPSSENELEIRNPVVTIDASSENELEIRNPVVIIDASSENELEIRNPIVTIDPSSENELDYDECSRLCEQCYSDTILHEKWGLCAECTEQICNDCDYKKLCFMCNDNYQVFDGKCELCLSLCYICHIDEVVSLSVGRCKECIKSKFQDKVAKIKYENNLKNYKNELEIRNPVVTINARSENELEIRNPVVTINARSENEANYDNELNYEECQVCYWDEAVSSGLCLKCIKERNNNNNILRKYKKCSNKLF
jgi:hypothetical protein